MRNKKLIILVSIILMISIFLLFFIDSIINSQLKKQASNAYGAKIDIAKSSLSFFPPTLTLHHIEISDKKNPLLNIYTINKLECSLSVYPLLQKKLIINSLKLSGIQTNTKRQYSGKLVQKESKKPPSKKNTKNIKSNPKDTNIIQDPSKSFSFTNFIQEYVQVPSVSIDDLIKKEDLLLEKNTHEIKTLLKADIIKTQQVLNDHTTLNKSLAEIERLIKESYAEKDTFSSLKSLYNNRKKLNSHYQKVKKDIAFKQNLLTEKKAFYQKQIQGLKQSAQADYQRLENTLMLDNQKSNPSQTLLIGPVQHLVNKVLAIFTKNTQQSTESKKQSASKNGQIIHFPITNPLPRFWLKEARISQEDPALFIKCLLKNLSSNNALIKDSTSLVLTYKQTAKIDLNLTGNSYLSPDKKSLNLMANFTNIPIHINPYQASTASGNSTIDITNDQLIGNFSLVANHLKLAKNNVSNPFVAAILTRIKNPSLSIKLSGNINEPKVNISSDIDNLLKHAFKQQLQNEQKKQKEQLKKQLDARLNLQEDSLKSLVSDFLLASNKTLNTQNNNIDQEKNKALKLLNEKISNSESIKNAAKSLEKALKNISF